MSITIDNPLLALDVKNVIFLAELFQKSEQYFDFTPEEKRFYQNSLESVRNLQFNLDTESLVVVKSSP